MAASNELSILPPADTALQVFTAPQGLDPFLAVVRQEIDAFVPDVSTKKGRDAVASIAYKVAKSKTALDALGKELVDDLKKKPRLIDAERKRMRDLLDAWRDEVRLPLSEWEAAEKARTDKFEADIAAIVAAADVDWPPGVSPVSSADLRARLAWVSAVEMGGCWAEYQVKASVAKSGAVDRLLVLIADAERREAMEAENARLLSEQAERDEAARLELVRVEAAQAERARIDLELEQERLAVAEREAAHSRELAQAVEAERARLAAVAVAEQKAAADAEAAAARAASDVEHRRSIHRDLIADLEVLGVSAETTKALIAAVLSGRVRHISINY